MEYLVNNGKKWHRILHIAVKPGGKITISELKRISGRDVSDNEFMHWLRNRIHKTDFKIIGDE